MKSQNTILAHDMMTIYLLSNIFGASDSGSKSHRSESYRSNDIVSMVAPPYTEIFSKRRKIYSDCVEGYYSQHILSRLIY